MSNYEVNFANNVVSYRIKIEMPDCTELLAEEGEEEPQTVSFAVEIERAEPEGVRLSKKNICFIDIEPDNTEEELKEAREREAMIDFFI